MTGAALQDALLGEAELSQLLFDIEHVAELIAVVVRPLGARRAAGPTVTPALADAHALLRARAASVQLRYRYGGEEWWDTLVPAGTETRLVRISHTRALALDEPPRGSP